MPAGVRGRGAVAVRAVAVAAAVALGVTMTTLPADSADTSLTVTGVDSLGFPYVDLVVSGIPGDTASDPPAISVSQFGQRVPTTATWLLADSQPLAVVTDTAAATLAQVQGIVGELVQAMPPGLPMSLVSTRTGQASPPSVNRNGFMSALERQRPASTEPISTGITSAASAGIQHVLVVTTCASPVPSALPIGVITDVIGVGPGCTAEWRTALAGQAGRFASAPDTTGALAALDAMVTAWRSSVVLIAQVSTRQPLQVGFGTQKATVSIGGSSTPAPTATGPTSSSGGSDGMVLVLGLLLLALAVLLAAVWLARRRRGPREPEERELDFADEVERMAVAHSRDPEPDRAPAPAVIDLRDRPRAAEPVSVGPAPAVEQPVALEQPVAVEQPVAIDAGLTPDAPTIMPLMAVATPAVVGEAERPRSASVVRRDVSEEPGAMAEEQVSNDSIDQADQADAEVATQEVPSEAAEQAVEDAPEIEAVEDAPEVQVVEDAPAIEAVAAPEAETAAMPAASSGLAPVEFNWTPLEFSPLAWRYDAEPEQDSTIDLREPAAVDIREKSGRRQPRRKKANR